MSSELLVAVGSGSNMLAEELDGIIVLINGTSVVVEFEYAVVQMSIHFQGTSARQSEETHDTER